MPVAARGEDLQVEHPVRGRHAPAFDFHPTQTRVLGSPLVWNQVIQVRQAGQKRRLTATWVMESLHREQFPVDGVMRLIQERAHRRHLRLFEHRIPACLLVLNPVAHVSAVLCTYRGRNVVDKAAEPLA